ncbi:VQ motif-containing protein [Melia azedarach]|uniref:VQ motif-containing protein n=1 Tax=Melia azedarach TaxID=155640 RepID=A0ACC1YS02_MELAZ|nr:VQ motif-containing protein [Melia azedarach]
MSGGGCGRADGGSREPVKIVLINTRYVETDETSFKSIVQELTGKESGVVSNNNENNIVPTKSRNTRPYSGMKMEEGMIQQSASAAGIEMCKTKNSVLKRDLSLKEFDRLLKEMPPVDELYNGFWAD